MKSKSDVRSTRSVPPLAPCLPPFDELLEAGEANPAATSRLAPIANVTTESQSLLFIGLLSTEQARSGSVAGPVRASSKALDASRPAVVSDPSMPVSAGTNADRRSPEARRRAN